jgi:hypothetical protein
MKNSLRTVKQKSVNAVWCDRCCVRIAPYEQKREMDGKMYHEDCYFKSFANRDSESKSDVNNDHASTSHERY